MNKLFNQLSWRLSKFFNKDIEFFKLLSWRSKKLLLYYIFFYIIIFYIGIIKYQELLPFLILIILLLILKMVIEFIIYFGFNNEFLKTFIRKHDLVFEKFLKILLFIQKWKSPLLVLLLYLDKLFLKFFRYIIYKINIDEYKKQKKYIFFQFLIINLLGGPFKFILGLFYSMLNFLIEMPFSFFFLIRSIGILLNIFIFSKIYIFIFNIFGFLNIFIYSYFFLVFISLWIRYIDNDFKYLKIQYMNSFMSTDYLILIRNHCTFFGIFILLICRYRLKLLDKKYIDHLSSSLKVELEEGYYKYHEYMKRNAWLYTISICNEIKNKPSFYFYLNLIIWISVVPLKYCPNNITNILYIKYKAKELELELPFDIISDLNFLYQLDFLRMKFMLFILWDIEDYRGNNNWNYITYIYNDYYKIFHIGGNTNIYNYMDFSIYLTKTCKNFTFYDPDINMEFFNKMYIMIGIVPYSEHPEKTPIFNDLLSKYAILIQEMEERLYHVYSLKYPENFMENPWIRLSSDVSDISDQYIKQNEVSAVELKIKDWIIDFLDEQRREWTFLLGKESIEERNWRILKEIDFLLKEKKVK